jgi:iron(III) transport system substrate-binding protein
LERRVHTCAVLTVAFAFALGGCGGSSEPKIDRSETGYEQVFAAIQGLHAKQRTAKLLALAKKDGGDLSLYTSAKSDVAEALAGGFEDFSGLDVALYRATTEAVAARLSEEARADFHGADVVEADGVALYNLNRESLLVDYRPDGLTRLAPGSDRDGWTACEFVTFVVSWNTKLVHDGEQPRSWEDLADPRWKGKLALEFGDFEWYGTLRDYLIKSEGKSEAEVDRLFQRMGQNALVFKGHTFMTQLLAEGEVDVAASAFASTVDQFRKDGASVSWQPPVEPVIVRTNGAGLVQGSRNPAAAVLYLEWLANDGQDLLAKVGREPVRKDLALGRTIRSVPVDYAQLVTHQKEWSSDYERILSKSEKAPEES